MSELSAGRELDALVAEVVMGYVWRCPKWTRNTAHWPEPLKALMPPDNTWTDYEALRGNEVEAADFDREVPKFSTNIAAAWTVWDKLAKEHSWELAWRKTPFREGWFIADAGEYELVTLGFGATVPLAICDAALAAVGPRDA